MWYFHPDSPDMGLPNKHFPGWWNPADPARTYPWPLTHAFLVYPCSSALSGLCMMSGLSSKWKTYIYPEIYTIMARDKHKHRRSSSLSPDGREKRRRSRKAPPKYGDLGKQTSDLFNKGYHFGLIKLDVGIFSSRLILRSLMWSGYDPDRNRSCVFQRRQL